MKETELKLHPCYCGGEMKIEKVPQNGGMDGTYWNWELTCNKCGLTKSYAADDFYGRKYKTFEEAVDDWNKKREESKTRNLYEFVNGIEPEVVYICDPDKSPCKGSELCYKPGGCFYTTYKDRALDPSTPLYMAESLIKVKEEAPECQTSDQS